MRIGALFGFGSVALGLHVAAAAVLIGPGVPGGAEGAGDGGADTASKPAVVTMSEAAALVRDWTAPPPIQPDPPAPPQLAAVGRLPAVAAHAEPPVVPPVQPGQVALALPQTPADLPRIDTTPAELTATAPPVLRSPRPPARADRSVSRSASLPQAGQRQQQASGQGQAGSRGEAGAAPAATVSTADRQSLMASWGAQIRDRINRARPNVRGRGVVVMRLQVARNGRLAGVSVAQSSGNAALDQAALRAVQNAGRFAAAPAGLTDASYGFSLPLRFR